MPTYHVTLIGGADTDAFWVYALDDSDARDQIASALRIDTFDEAKFEARETAKFRMPLNVILHSSGEWTQVPPPKSLDCVGCDETDGSETFEA